MRRPAATAVLAALLAACSGVAASSPAVTASPLQSLLRIDQLAHPGFTVYAGPHSESAVDLAGSSSAAAGLNADGFSAAATVRYTRQDDFTVADGPLDVTSTAERFANADGANSAFSADVARLDAVAGATAISTGPLGDAAHAEQEVRRLPNGLAAVQYTVEWRVANVVNVIVIRGRQGGTTLQDALTLAYAQVDNEPIGLAAT